MPPRIQKKVCLLGEFAVGKTSLMQRFVHNRFSNVYSSTIGAKVSTKVIEIHDGPSVGLVIWDLAGGEEFSHIQESYLKGSAGAILVCDLTRKKTLVDLSGYAQRLLSVAPQANLILAANKLDLQNLRQIDQGALVKQAEKLGVDYHLVSAKTGEGVEQVFEELARVVA